MSCFALGPSLARPTSGCPGIAGTWRILSSTANSCNASYARNSREPAVPDKHTTGLHSPGPAPVGRPPPARALGSSPDHLLATGSGRPCRRRRRQGKVRGRSRPRPRSAPRWRMLVRVRSPTRVTVISEALANLIAALTFMQIWTMTSRDCTRQKGAQYWRSEPHVLGFDACLQLRRPRRRGSRKPLDCSD